MRKKIKLQIPTPCNENWNAMSPKQEGRFCSSCQKTVIDFTSMSDKEVFSYFASMSTNTCGRFRGDQLSKNLGSGDQNKLPWFRYFLNILIPALLITSKSYSQGKVKSNIAVCTSPVKHTEIKPIILGGVSAKPIENFIAGKITANEGEAMPGATIMIKGTRLGCAADKDGNFMFHLDKPLPLTLVASSVGYQSVEIIVDDQNAASPINIALTGPSISGEVYVKGYTIHNWKPNVYHQFKRILSDSFRISPMKIYPNPLPLSSVLTVEYSCKKSGNYTIEISDVNGRLMQVHQYDMKSILLRQQIHLKQGMTAGTYLVQIFDPKGIKVSTQKLIVKN